MDTRFICCALLAASLSCVEAPVVEEAPRRADTDYLCAEHGTHHFDNRGEQCACLSIPPGEYAEYHIFTETGETGDPAAVPALMEKLRDTMEDRIVSKVMHRIVHAMKKDIIKYWRFEQMRIPVTIRGFTKRIGDTHHVLVAAAMTKYSLSPRGIIMYLPLEYKMHILEKKKDE